MRLRTRINGEMRQSSSTANMIFGCAQLNFFSTGDEPIVPAKGYLNRVA